MIAHEGKIGENLCNIKSFVEKPAGEKVPRNVAIISRYMLTPEIFGILEHQKPRRDGEVQLTVAIDTINQTQRVFTHVFNGQRLDVGYRIEKVIGYLETTAIQYDLIHPQVKDDSRKYIIRSGKKLASEKNKN